MTKPGRKYDLNEMPVVILSAGISHKMKTREPRSLLKLNDKFLIEHQIHAISKAFWIPKITLVCGYKVERIAKKISNYQDQISIVENSLYNETGSAESLRLAIKEEDQKILFMHGDLFFNWATLDHLCYEKSFLLVDSKKQMAEKEVSIVINDNVAQHLSYGVKTGFKWCQIAYVANEEYNMLKFILNKKSSRNKVSFELINEIINLGGEFSCYEPPNMKIVEIDCIKDIKNAENINS